MITELGAVDGESVLDDFNTLPQTNGEVFAFFRSSPAGRDVATLLRWAARDNDRTMLFGAEIESDLAASHRN